jgi:hypothetical protein
MIGTDALWCPMGKGGRTAMPDWKGWTHSSAGLERLDAQQFQMEKVGRTAVPNGKGWTHSSASPLRHYFTIHYFTNH